MARESRAERLRRHLAEVTRDQLGRFVEIDALRECGPAGCDLEGPPDLSGLMDQQQAFLRQLEDLIGDMEGPSDAGELREVVEAFRVSLEDSRADLEGRETADAFAVRAERRRDVPLIVQGKLEEVVDLAQFDGPTRARLALLLAAWNPDARRPFFVTSANGRRVLARQWWRLDLNHPWIRAHGIDDAVRQSMDEGDDWDVIAGGSDAERDQADDDLGAQLEARGRAQARGWRGAGA